MKLSVKNLTFGYPMEPALFENVNFEVCPGEILSAIGPNGSGKTSLLKLLLGFEKPLSGVIAINDDESLFLNEKQRFKKISYVSQEKILPRGFTVFETILFGLSGEISPFRTPSRKDEKRVSELLERFSMEAFSGREIGNLSGGELQMVLILRALIKSPELLILDEPESGLDFANQLRILDLMKSLSEDHVSIIFNTHYPDHALRISDNTLLLYPTSHSLYGKTENVITEENIEDAFGVSVRIETIRGGENEVRTVVPISRERGKEA